MGVRPLDEINELLTVGCVNQVEHLQEIRYQVIVSSVRR